MKKSHFAWNFIGLLVPLLIAFMALPKLLDNLGNERFGLLALAWGLIGYAGALDFGIGRALTKVVSSRIGANKDEEISTAFMTAVKLTMQVSIPGACVICVLLAFGATRLLVLQTISNVELIISIALVCIALPLQAISSTYKGLNEAYLNFRAVSIIRMLLGASTFGLPLIVTQFTTFMPALIGSLAASRLFALFLYRVAARKCIKHDPSSEARFSKEIKKELLHFGGWFTVSGIVSPLMVQSDRFFIASIVSVAAVSAYVIPFELVTQLAIVTTAISTVAFPSLAAHIQRDRASAWASFAKWLGRTILVMLIACTTMALALPHLLPLWVGTSLQPDSVRIGQWLCLGIFVNSVGVMYFAYLHADGRFRDTAILHLVELPLYVAVLLLCLSTFGTVGAAIAWVIRVCADTGILAFFCHRSRAKQVPVGAPA